MRNFPLFLLIGAIIAAPAFAAGHGGGGHGMGSSMNHGNAFGVASSSAGMSHMSTPMGHSNNPSTHGAPVSQTAHQAKASGMKVGPQVRAVARSKSQGPSHANANAIAHASSNSVLSSSTKTATTTGVSIRHSSGSHR